MNLQVVDNPLLTVAFALAAGMLVQSVAHHMRIPGIVLLLLVGVLLGPEGAGLVYPDSLGLGLYALVSFGVAIILFEGGMRLELRRLRHEQVVIRRLVTMGAAATALGGALAAKFVMGWGWRLSALFGTLVIVTGPTVVIPLLRRLRIQQNVSTVLEAEGVLIDAIGAITAVVALEVALSPTDQSLMLAAPSIAFRLGFGALAGLVGGLFLALVLRLHRLIPAGFKNVFVLSVVVLIYELSDAIVHESGIAAATVAGMVIGNMPPHLRRELADFKEQLTVLLIGMLFVLLAADVRMADVISLGWPGLVTVLLLMVVVRPAVVSICALGTALSWKERALIAWLAPRGVVAAAVASLFAFELERAGMPGGERLQALVFATIAATVITSGLTGKPVSRFLGLGQPSDTGWVILGGNAFALQIAKLLQRAGRPVTCLDNDPRQVQDAEQSGLHVLHGNALEPRTLARTKIAGRSGVIAATSNAEVNFLFVQRARAEAKELRCLMCVTEWSTGVTPELVTREAAEVCCGGVVDVARWSRRIEREEASVVWWRCVSTKPKSIFTGREPSPPYLPLVCRTKDGVTPVGHETRLRHGDDIACLVDEVHLVDAGERLRAAGFVPLTS